MKTFRIFLLSGLTVDVVAAKVEVRPWRTGEPLLGETLFAATDDAGLLVAAFRPEAIAGVHADQGI